jgi:hypothetical protein
MRGFRLDFLPMPESICPAYQRPQNPVVRPPGFDPLLRVRQTEEPMLVKGWGIRGFKWEGSEVIGFSNSQLFLLKSRVL